MTDDVLAVESVNNATEFMAELLSINPSHFWILQIFVVILVTLTASAVVNYVLKRLRDKLRKTRTLWDDSLVEAARKPARTLIWVLGICYAVEIVYNVTNAEVFAMVDTLRMLGIIGVVTWWLIRFVSTFEQNFIAERHRKKKSVDLTTTQAVSKLVKASILITAVLVTLQNLGFSISGVLAFGGIGGIAIGFAAKDLLANVFGTIGIYYDRPFSVGDWIRSPDKDIEGSVEKIGWRQTVIQSFDKRPIYVPNALFSTIVVQNPSRMSHRRISETIRIRHEDVGAVEAITHDIRTMLQEHEGIDATQSLMVYFTTIGQSSLDIMVYCFTRTKVWAEYLAVQHDVLLKINDIIVSHGARLALPATTLHMPDVAAMQQEKA